MSSRTTLLILGAGMALALSAGAIAQANKSPSGPQTMHGAAADVPAFADLDKDNHGYLKRSDLPKDVEGLKALRAHFNEADADHNGRLDASEYATYTHANGTPATQQQ